MTGRFSPNEFIAVIVSDCGSSRFHEDGIGASLGGKHALQLARRTTLSEEHHGQLLDRGFDGAQ